MLLAPNGRTADAAVNSDESSQPPNPVSLVLEVTRGRTQFRRRPVKGPRFLIGAGSTCDLRLGGDPMPALHSLITIQGSEVHIEAISPQPTLLVNREQVQMTVLHDGDVIRIGEMELLAHLAVGFSPAQTQVDAPPAAVELPIPDVAADAVSDLSAAELVELIEQEEREVERYEARRREGAQALAQAILSRRDEQAAERQVHAAETRVPGAPHFRSARRRRLSRLPIPVGHERVVDQGADSEFMNGLEQLANQMAGLSQELHRSSHRASEREATYAGAANLLLEAQQQLVTQLETLLEQVQTLQQQQPTGPKLHTRAIA